MTDDRIPFALRPHSVFCGECGGWQAPVIEKIGENEWFVKCECGEILATMRGSLEPA
jgi:hypothetical protein